MNRGKRGVLVISLVFTLLLLQVSAQSGCFTEPTVQEVCTSIDRSNAETLCNSDTTCLTNFFFQGVSCDDVSFCQSGPGWCTDECRQVSFQAQCTDRTNFEAGFEQPDVCNTGCCVCGSDLLQGGDNICDFGSTQTQCNAFCGSFGSGFFVERFDTTVDSDSCLNTCSAITGNFSTVQGFVVSDTGILLEGVEVDILGQLGMSASDGFYQVVNVPSGSATLKASKAGFSTFFDALVLSAGEILEKNITLVSAGIGTLQGSVLDGSNSSLQDVLVSVAGPVVDQQTTLADGKFRFDLPAGSYTIEVSKLGFETLTFTVQLSQGAVEDRQVVITREQVGSVSGRISDPDGGGVPFAEILIDGSTVAHSNSAGFYSITLPADLLGVTYQVGAAKKPQFQDALSQPITLGVGDQKNLDFILLRAVGSCFFPLSPAPASFDANHIPGEPGVNLIWPRPCPEVDGFIIERFRAEGGVLVPEFTTFIDIDQPRENFEFIDENLLWQTTYRYTIKALYLDGEERTSATINDTITLGDPRCAGRFIQGDFVEFCEDERNRVSCSGENIVESVLSTPDSPSNCELLGASYFCAGPDLSLDTFCRNAGACTSQALGANPFGLFFTRDQCYGAPTQNGFTNFCYFDQSNSIFDACYSCAQIESCFDYVSQDACEVNNCQASVTDCSWIPAVSQFGTGYCVPNNYGETDHCSDCSSSGLLFENNFCDNTICSALGACYSNTDQSACISCGETSNCYDFGNDFECTGGQPTGRQLGSIIDSNDQCSLGTCAWDPSINSCYKDGNANSEDDCSAYSDARFTRCSQDNDPPETIILPRDGTVLITGSNHDITFQATDDNELRDVTYCVDRQNTCQPNLNQLYTSGKATVDLSTSIDQVYAGSSGPEGPFYYVRFFSQDEFDNLEGVQSRAIEVNREPPTFVELNYTVDEQAAGSTITITVATDTFSTCTDELKDLRGGTPLSKLAATPNNFWQVSYDNQQDGVYTYSITCQDGAGNTATGELFPILVDAIRFVNVVAPPTVTRETSLNFAVNTSDEFLCDLFERDQRKETLSSSDFLLHTSSLFTNFVANTFYGDFHVQCSGVGPGGLSDSVSIPFTIDTAPPSTQAILASADGTIRNFMGTGWEGGLSGEGASVVLECADTPMNGFGCNEIRYCLTPIGTVCSPSTLFSDPISENLDEDFKICYKSTDKGGAEEPVKCGTIRLTPTFGVSLVDPPEFTYNGLKYGVSNKDSFNLTISSIVQTDVCKYSGFEEFNFTSLVSPTKVFESISDASHKKDNFSDFNTIETSYEDAFSAFIQCNSSVSRELGPKEPFSFVIDKTSPIIRASFAEPTQVISGNSLIFVVQTDDPSLCRFDKEATSFDNMVHNFPDASKRIFRTEHRGIVLVSALDDKKTITYQVACRNGAGDTSQTKTITYSVDFSAAGTITSLNPHGVFQSQQVTLEAKTNKPALCRHSLEGSSQLTEVFPAVGGLTHNTTQLTAEEKTYRFLVRCQFDEASRDGVIEFSIDRTPPTLSSIEDGNASCSLSSVTPHFVGSDNVSSIVRYEYRLFARGSSQALANGTVESSSITITDLNLSEGDEYFIEAKAVDSAGNIGQAVTSDGFLATSESSSECQEESPPLLSLSKNQTDTGIEVTIHCVDETGCGSITYGSATEAENCEATTAYVSSFVVERTSYICYAATDNAGNNATGIQQIVIADCDGDGVPNSKDQCGTLVAEECQDASAAGSLVGSDGCEAVSDRDEDKLDDDWETRYNANDCPLDPLQEDSDGDGVDDGEEDYDGDGLTNYDEFIQQSDPCIAPDTDGDGVPDHLDSCIGTLASEVNNIELDETSDFYGCAPSERDSDGDGMPDSWETDNGLNPNDPSDAAEDLDGDGLTNLQEYELKDRFVTSTNPNLKDTDGDGFSDSKEIEVSTNPVDGTSFPESKILPLVLLILGFVLLVGGIIAAIVLARRRPPRRLPPQRQVSQRQPVVARRRQVEKPRPRIADILRTKRKERAQKRRESRASIFGIFSSTSPKKEPVPQLSKIVNKKSSEFNKLAHLTKEYTKRKGTLAPKLSTDERKIFRELEEISNKVGGARKTPHSTLTRLFEIEGDHMKDVFHELSEKIAQHENKDDEAIRKLRKLGRTKKVRRR